MLLTHLCLFRFLGGASAAAAPTPAAVPALLCWAEPPRPAAWAEGPRPDTWGA